MNRKRCKKYCKASEKLRGKRPQYNWLNFCPNCGRKLDMDEAYREEIRNSKEAREA